MNTSPMNDSDMLKMQQDAVRRVRMMQERAQQAGQEEAPTPPPRTLREPPGIAHKETRPPMPEARTQPPHGGEPASPAKRPPQPVAPRRPAAGRSSPARFFSPKKEAPPEDLLKLLTGGNDRTLLIMVLLLLINEKADTYLIMSMLYLLL